MDGLLDHTPQRGGSVGGKMEEGEGMQDGMNGRLCVCVCVCAGTHK